MSSISEGQYAKQVEVRNASEPTIALGCFAQVGPACDAGIRDARSNDEHGGQATPVTPTTG